MRQDRHKDESISRYITRNIVFCSLRIPRKPVTVVSSPTAPLTFLRLGSNALPRFRTGLMERRIMNGDRIDDHEGKGAS
jgi:hypothetical protein